MGSQHTQMMAEKSDESPGTPGSANVVYGDRMQPEQLAWLRNVHFFFLGIASLGTVLQILQVFVEPVGWASTAVYYVYNLAAIVIARMLLITLKFEHKEALVYGIRVTIIMIVYALAVIFTLGSTENDTILTLMAVGGIINVIILVPAGIYELFILYRSRSLGKGLKHAVPLNTCQNGCVIAVLVWSTIVMLGMAVLCIIIFATHTTDDSPLWWIELAFYACLNLLVIVSPQVLHWIETDVQLWPVVCFGLQNFLELASALLLAAALFTLDDDDISRTFGIVGVVNGLLGAIAVLITLVRIYHNPRTEAGDTLSGQEHPEVQLPELQAQEDPSNKDTSQM